MCLASIPEPCEVRAETLAYTESWNERDIIMPRIIMCCEHLIFSVHALNINYVVVNFVKLCIYVVHLRMALLCVCVEVVDVDAE